MGVLSKYHVHAVPMGVRRIPRLELQTVVSYCVGARNQTWVLCKSSKCSKLQNHVSFS